MAPRLRMGGAVHLLPLYVFVTWTGTTLALNEDNTVQVIVVVMLHIYIYIDSGDAWLKV
jgi:hypothetical protein